MSQFDYKQRPPDNRKEFERRWDKWAKKNNSVTIKNEPFGSHNCADQSEADLLNHIYKVEKYKTTEQKQPSISNPSTE